MRSVHNDHRISLPPSVYEDGLRPAKRSKYNIVRWWRSHSRLQRNLFSGLCLLFVVGCLLMITTDFAQTNGLRSRSDVDASQNLASPSGVVIKDSDNEQPPDQQPNADAYVKEPVAILQKVSPADSTFTPKIHFTGPQNERQTAVVNAFKHAWAGYKKYAWGFDHLKPLSKTGHNWFKQALTMVDSLDTMLIMGLNQDFTEARDHIVNDMQFDADQYVNFFESTIRVLGGLLSAYHLSGDRQLLEKARQVADRLVVAFDTPSHVPFSDVNFKTRRAKSPPWSPESSLSEVATVQLEMRDVSRQTGLSHYETLAFNTSQHIHRLGCAKYDGLCPMFINPKTGQWKSGSTITFGARADSYYEYLLKQWLQTGKTVDWLRDDYTQAMASANTRLFRRSSPNNMLFVGEVIVSTDKYYAKMDHLACFLAGTLALGSANGLGAEHMVWAQELGATCHAMYLATATGLAPEIAHFNLLPGAAVNDIFIKPLDAHCILRPEAIEAWFYLYRLTGNSTYQEWGWQAFQAIETHAKVATGYTSVQNAKKIPVQRKDMMESFFLAETLKYLYLLFDDTRSILPLDKWVFNTEAHPMPVYER